MKEIPYRKISFACAILVLGVALLAKTLPEYESIFSLCNEILSVPLLLTFAMGALK